MLGCARARERSDIGERSVRCEREKLRIEDLRGEIVRKRSKSFFFFFKFIKKIIILF